jgi:outer membrane protein assembly factor BamD (BamD/ComL family)
MSYMLTEGTRLLLTLACAVSILGGCASVPPAPANVASRANTESDEHEGWLFNSLTGQKKASDTKPAAAAAVAASPTDSSNAVVAASANLPGPLVPGPASPSAARMPESPTGPALAMVASDSPEAGPPPSIPSQLPGPPPGAVSIDKLEKQKKEEKKSGFEWSDLAPENIYKNMKKSAGYGPDEKIARATMAEAKTLFDEAAKESDAALRVKKFTDAGVKFATVADRWPDSPLEEDALFLQGESEFFSDQYPKAHDTFGGLLKKYTNTRHLDIVMSREFALGRYWEQLYDAKPTWPTTPNVTDGTRPMFDTFGYAVQAYERIRQHDPTGPLAHHSLFALGNAYFRRGQFEDAAYNYDLLRKEYPNSNHQMAAHLLGLQCKMRVYQGAWYDGAALKDAKKIADQTLSQFGDKLGDERERVTRARAQIIEEQANREFTFAQYYDQHEDYRAARIYYRRVISGYAGTQKAKEAEERIEQIKGLPDVPPSRFAWLTGLWGGDKSEKK